MADTPRSRTTPGRIAAGRGRCPAVVPSAGHAQCGFGEARVVIGGVERKARCFVLDLRETPGAAFVSALAAAPGEGHQMQKEHE